jgi:quinol monooxygenase YgiN
MADAKRFGAKKYFSARIVCIQRGVIAMNVRIVRADYPEEQPMQRVTVVKYAIKPDRADENEKLSRAVFAQLRANNPPHIAYTLLRDGNEFLHVFINAKEDDASAVIELPLFKEFSRNVEERYQAPPELTRYRLNLLETYGLRSGT